MKAAFAGSPEMHRRIWRLAGPLIIANISTPLLGAADTAVMGHLAEAYYLGAVAVGAALFNFIYWGFGFLRMGTTGFVAQARGAGDVDEVRAIIARAFILGAGLAAALILLQGPIARIAIPLFDASPEVDHYARSYFLIRIWAAPAALANYAFLGAFLGLQNARAALILQVWMNGINIALDFAFVFWFGWGVESVAAATVISEYLAVGVGAVLLHRMLRRTGGRLNRHRLIDGAAMRRMLAVNRDIFIRTICLIFAFSYFTAVGAGMGDEVLAANAVLRNFQFFMAFGLDGFAHAAEALVGDAVGARDRARFREAVKVATIWAFLVAIVYALAYAVFGGLIIALLTGIEAVRATAAVYMPWVVATPLISVWSFQLDGIFIGATRAAVLRNAMIASLAVFLLACHALIPAFGNHGLWAAMMLFMAARAISLGVFYPWLERSVTKPEGAAA